MALQVSDVEDICDHPAPADVLLQVLRVHPVRRAADVEHCQVAIEQLVHGRVRPRVTLLVDLAGEPADRLVRLGRRLLDRSQLRQRRASFLEFAQRRIALRPQRRY